MTCLDAGSIPADSTTYSLYLSVYVYVMMCRGFIFSPIFKLTCLESVLGY
ncbi:MAG: hypothetical protein P8I34_00485 [Flavobacteriaceae bacterium]|nr:hypothetical protein [Flavobacteriaceae bacterium]